MKKRIFIGFAIYLMLSLVFLGACGIFPLLIIGLIYGGILYHVILRKMTSKEILICMGANYLENKFSKNPLCKNLMSNE